MTRTGRIFLLLATTLISAGVVFSFPAISQDPEYHNFADQRVLWGVPHFGDVLSNILFILAGVWGLWTYRKVIQDPSRVADARERFALVPIFSGIILVGIGSGYYHWAPSNETLFWDRLPITVVFMSIVAMMLGERIAVKVGVLALGPLLILGLASVVYWQATELAGRGDLRLYGFVLFYPMLFIPLLILLFPPRYTGIGYLYEMLGLYVAAKGFEFLDRPVYETLGGVMSGHSLKHLFAAGAMVSLIRYVQHRRAMDRKN